ncbi:MAG: hypothetical protein ILP16_12250, partial [Spirochaetales bacterium]|nr:hypothetical protein [Spirochaetales bacterium]
MQEIFQVLRKKVWFYSVAPPPQPKMEGSARPPKPAEPPRPGRHARYGRYASTKYFDNPERIIIFIRQENKNNSCHFIR